MDEIEMKNEQVVEKKVLPYSDLGMVMGICSLALFWFFGIVFAILGLIFSSIAKRKYNKNPSLYISCGKATAGLITSIIGLSFGLLFLMMFWFAMNASINRL